MQHAQNPIICHNQTVAVASHYSGQPFTVLVLDVAMNPAELREGIVTINGRQGWVVQSYPPLYEGEAMFFLYQWLDQPGISVWNNGR